MKVRQDDGSVRVVSENGRKSWLFESEGLFGDLNNCIEVADHHEDGTTDAYEYRFSWNPLSSNKGAKKNSD